MDPGLVRLLGEAAGQRESDRKAAAGSEVTAIDSSGPSGKGENRPKADFARPANRGESGRRRSAVQEARDVRPAARLATGTTPNSS